MSKSKVQSDLLKLVGVVEPKMLKGQTGLYFKFADAASNNAESVEVYFKPKFTRAYHLTETDNLTRISWLEINVLWVGPMNFPDFDSGWKPLRGGNYISKDGEIFQGVLLGKIMLPMGEFNDDFGRMHKWVAGHCAQIQKYIDTTLMPQIHGKQFMPLQVIFDHMAEGMSTEVIEIPNPQIFLNKEYEAQQKSYATKASAKFDKPKAASDDSGEE